MPQVCLVGKEDVSLQYELLSRKTARNALSSYDIAEPFANSVSVETVSLGAAVSLLNDLDWYLVRFVRTALVRDESISDDEWLSRGMATAIRDDCIDQSDSRTYLKIYGLEAEGQDDDRDESPEGEGAKSQKGGEGYPADGEAHVADHESNSSRPMSGVGEDTRPPRLVEPMLVTPTDGDVPEYDLRDVSDTIVVRVTQEEFGDGD